MPYPAHRTKLFQNSIFYSSSEIVNALMKKCNIPLKKIIITFIDTQIVQDPLYNLEDFN